MKAKVFLRVFLGLVICVFMISKGMGGEQFVESGNVDDYAVLGVYEGEQNMGAGVKGWATNPNASGETYGVLGVSSGPRGMGILGYCTADTGVTYGVFGSSVSPQGYGVYSKGNAYTQGDHHVQGNLINDGIRNLALDARASASSEHDINNSDNYSVSKVNDGIYGRWDANEWGSAGEGSGAWVELRWDTREDWVTSVTFNKIVLYDRCNRYDHINDALLIITRIDGSETRIHLGMFPYGGAPKEIHLTQDEGTDIVALRLEITEVADTTLNVGLSEIECRYDANIWRVDVQQGDQPIIIY